MTWGHGEERDLSIGRDRRFKTFWTLEKKTTFDSIWTLANITVQEYISAIDVLIQW